MVAFRLGLLPVFVEAQDVLLTPQVVSNLMANCHEHGIMNNVENNSLFSSGAFLLESLSRQAAGIGR